ncbi:hypothetical protein MMC13_007554 [Lambiella insularis]|nr:hypothetical protein [Lambiella insularis]
MPEDPTSSLSRSQAGLAQATSNLAPASDGNPHSLPPPTKNQILQPWYLLTRPRNIENIPSELRLHIYTYLLCDRNASIRFRDHQFAVSPRFHTAVFTVSRKISAESLHYFYAENAFIAVGSTYGSLLNLCTRKFPAFTRKSRPSGFNDYALYLQLVPCKEDDPPRPATAFVVFAGRHFSTFVKCVNEQQLKFSQLRVSIPSRATQQGSLQPLQVSEPFLDMKRCRLAASFEGLPPEIRLHIYSYLLVERNVIDFRRRRIYPVPGASCPRHDYTSPLPRFETAQFTVCKKISAESLHFFYNENAFVLVESNEQTVLNWSATVFPTVFSLTLMGIKGYALRIQLTQCKTSQRPEEAPSVGFAIFSGIHLHNFIRLLNLTEIYYVGLNHHTHIDLVFRTNSGYLEGNTRVADGFWWDLEDLREVVVRNAHLPLVPTASGDIDEKRVNEVMTASSLPSLHSSDSLARLKGENDRGDHFFQAGDYHAARGQYNLAKLSAFLHRLCRDRAQKSISQFEYESLMINYHTKLSLVHSKQGFLSWAVAEAQEAWRESATRAGGDVSTAAEKAALQYNLGCLQDDNGEFEEARRSLKSALAFAKDVAIKSKLKEVKAHLVRCRRDSGSQADEG